ncbi:MAG: hypothetical protein JWM68_5844 [Verrucomicrobiales bacterium]|nr:hypothetical protein [Verrucomicrobiales bacterium]
MEELETAMLAPNDHFDGKRFFNPSGASGKSFADFLRWMLNRSAAKWPNFLPNHLPSHRIENCPSGKTAVTFIGHSSFLLQIGATNILIDPVFSLRASPVQWIGPKRVRLPGIQMNDLPPIHLVLVSHNHYDHLDLATLRDLNVCFSPPVITPLKNKKLIASSGLENIKELDWWQSTETHELRITVVPAQHFSARKFSDRNKSLWGGFVIEGEGRTIFFAGDTGYNAEQFRTIGERYSHMDLAFLPIGAYAPRWFMKDHHMDPAEAVQAFLDLKAKRAIGMHFGTFQLTDEGIDEPVNALHRALSDKEISAEPFELLDFGETLLL